MIMCDLLVLCPHLAPLLDLSLGVLFLCDLQTHQRVGGGKGKPLQLHSSPVMTVQSCWMTGSPV